MIFLHTITDSQIKGRCSPARISPCVRCACWNVLLVALCKIGFLVSLQHAQAQPKAAKADRTHLQELQSSAQYKKHIKKSLAWLAKQQNEKQGFFPGKHRNAYTGMAALAFMSAGHLPQKGEFAPNVEKTLVYLARQINSEQSYFGTDGHGMYSHAICTLALAEAYGNLSTPAKNTAVYNALQPAVQLILKTQNKSENTKRGGWPYTRKKQDVDLSVTTWQILALTSAQNAGLEIPNDALDKARGYVRRTFDSKTGFSSRPGEPGTPPMWAAGIIATRCLGNTDELRNKAAVETSAQHLRDAVPAQLQENFYLSTFYFAHASTSLKESYQKNIFTRVYQALKERRKSEGTFTDTNAYDGGVYATSLAVMTMAVRNHFLPVHATP